MAETCYSSFSVTHKKLCMDLYVKPSQSYGTSPAKMDYTLTQCYTDYTASFRRKLKTFYFSTSSHV